jgi:hypothetical protein
MNGIRQGPSKRILAEMVATGAESVRLRLAARGPNGRDQLTRLLRLREHAELVGAIADTRATFESKGVGVNTAEREPVGGRLAGQR